MEFYVFVQAEDWNFTLASLQRPPKRVQNSPLKYCARFYAVVCRRLFATLYSTGHSPGGRLSYAFCRCFMMGNLSGLLTSGLTWTRFSLSRERERVYEFILGL